jgi:hypothetical protein
MVTSNSYQVIGLEGNYFKEVAIAQNTTFSLFQGRVNFEDL